MDKKIHKPRGINEMQQTNNDKNSQFNTNKGTNLCTAVEFLHLQCQESHSHFIKRKIYKSVSLFFQSAFEGEKQLQLATLFSPTTTTTKPLIPNKLG
jgi:hypothetical protein